MSDIEQPFDAHTNNLHLTSEDQAAVLQGRQPRKRSLKGGVIVYGDGAISVECLIRDLADGGVKIKLVNDIMVPNNFTLHIPSSGIQATCVVKWRKDRELGVEFLGPVVIKDNIKRQVVSPLNSDRTGSPILRR